MLAFNGENFADQCELLKEASYKSNVFFKINNEKKKFNEWIS